MADLVIMPRLGQSMEEGTIVRWFKGEGDSVQIGEPLLEVMSDKANFEVEAESGGTLLRILAQADETIEVNGRIAILGSPGESIESLVNGQTSAEPQILHSLETVAESNPSKSVSKPAQRISISPRARRIAEERGIDVSSFSSGSGPGGRILERDIIAFAESPPATPAEAGGRKRLTPLAAKVADDLGVDVGDLSLGLPGSRVTADIVRKSAVPPPSLEEGPAVHDRIPMRGLRKMIAENVTRSRQTAPHVTLTLEVDMTECARILPTLQSEVQKSHGVKVTYTDILIRAAARALADNPLCNAALIDDEIRVYADKNIGVAVATNSGLLVPVIRNADQIPLGQISAELRDLVKRCREGSQNQRDLSGGTFTITNLGAFGIDVFDPIIVPPQSCILGVGRVADKVVAVERQPAVRAMMNLCLSFDHRVLDGVPAAQFLQRVKQLLETPILSLL